MSRKPIVTVLAQRKIVQYLPMGTATKTPATALMLAKLYPADTGPEDFAVCADFVCHGLAGGVKVRRLGEGADGNLRYRLLFPTVARRAKATAIIGGSFRAQGRRRLEQEVFIEPRQA